MSAVVLVVACLSSFVLVSGRASAATRTLTATPDNGLADQVVAVHWSGFNPANPVTVYQCKGQPASLGDCFEKFPYPNGSNDENGSGVFAGVTQPDGTGTAFIEVRPSLQLPDLDCSAKNPCSVVAYENDGSPIPTNALPATAAVAPLHFAPTTTDCPKVRTPDVTTIGEESTSIALYAWSAATCTGAKPLSLDYTAQGSPLARSNFLQGNSDVGLTSMPATPDEVKGTRRKFTYAPVDVTGVVIGFNATDPTTGQKITDMTLSPRLVAELIAGWAFPPGSGNNLFLDPEFLALNPGHHWPTNAEPPLLRAERNADTYILTSWLAQDPRARAFLAGSDPAAQPDQFWKGVKYPTDVFESRDPNSAGTYNPRSGTLANVRRLFQFLPPGDGITPTAGTDGIFGVMDAVTARDFAIPTAKLLPAGAAPGAPAVAADPLALAASSSKMKTNPDGITKFPDVGAPGAYPLVKVDYAMVPTSGLAGAKAAKIGQFLDYVAGPGQKPGVLPTGYVPLPPDLVAQDAKARDAVVGQTGNAPAAPPALALAPVDQGLGSTDTGGFGDVGSGGGGSGGATSGAPAAVANAGAPTPGTALASSTRRPASNFVVAALRDFLGGDHQLLLPGIFAAGFVALLGGPVLTWQARARKRRGVPVTPGPPMSVPKP